MGLGIGWAPWMAWRYLRSRKRHGAVGVITWISVAGVAVATAATLCVLSVFNGFQSLLAERLDMLSPDAKVVPASGRVLSGADSLSARLRRLPQVAEAMPAVEERALAIYAGQEMPVRVTGVEPATFRRRSMLDSLLIAGDASFAALPAEGETTPEAVGDDSSGGFSEEEILAEALAAEPATTPSTVIAVGAAMRLGVRVGEGASEPLTVVVPRRSGTVNMANPSASLEILDTHVGGVYQARQSDFDKDYVMMPVADARRLFSIPAGDASSIYVYAAPGVSREALVAACRGAVGAGARVQDRLEQHSVQFRMATIEKWITFVLLAFILLIASFNMISSLAMLVIDKKQNLGVMRAMGARRRSIGNVFASESMLVTVIGGAIGIACGAALSLLQQHYGLIKLGGDPAMMIIDHYPAELHRADIAAVCAPLLLIGIFCALITHRFACRLLR